jgi:hypothetical protein
MRSFDFWTYFVNPMSIAFLVCRSVAHDLSPRPKSHCTELTITKVSVMQTVTFFNVMQVDSFLDLFWAGGWVCFLSVFTTNKCYAAEVRRRPVAL